MLLDDRGDETKTAVKTIQNEKEANTTTKQNHLPRIRRIDAKDVNAIQEELEGFAQNARLVNIGRQHAVAHIEPTLASLSVALRWLDPLNGVDHNTDEVFAVIPVESPNIHLAPDEIKVNRLTDCLRLAAACEIADTVADLCKHTENANVARGLEAEVVHEAVPEGLEEEVQMES
jgi:hypothetical protein